MGNTHSLDVAEPGHLKLWWNEEILDHSIASMRVYSIYSGARFPLSAVGFRLLASELYFVRIPA